MAFCLQPGQGRGIGGTTRALPVPLVPVDAEPGEVLLDQGREGLGRALGIGIVEAQDQPAAMVPGEEPVDEGGPGIAEVEPAGGARGEAENGGHGTARQAGRRGWAQPSL